MSDPDSVRVSLQREVWQLGGHFRVRIGLAMLFLNVARLANVSVPLTLKGIVDALSRPEQIALLPVALPAGYDTEVGERGAKLSSGERQRIVIACAILKNPPILIFDEATSTLESQSEREIQTELEQLARDCSTLVIAHRLSTVIHAHNIIVLERGGIVGQGSHPQLMERDGAYARLWRLQLQASPAY